MIEEDFFGREDILAILDKRLKGLKEGYRQNIALIGDKLIGKTSIIQHFLLGINDKEILPLYLEVNQDNMVAFTKRFILTFIYNLNPDKQILLFDTIDTVLENFSKAMPKTTEKIKAVKANFEKRKKEDLFLDIFELLRIFNQETGKFCLIILEEIQNLEALGLRNVYKELSKAIILDRKNMYLISSSHKYKAGKILADNLSMLFGNFEIINIGPFDIKTADNYIKEKISLDTILRSFLINFTEGHPFYLNLLCSEIKDMLENKANQTTNFTLLSGVLEDSLFHRWSTLNQYYEGILDNLSSSRNGQNLVKILLLLSDGYNRIKILAQAMRQSKKDILLKVSRLTETNMISRSADLFKINDPLFNFWLKSVYKSRISVINLDKPSQLKLFKNKLEEEYRIFVIDSQKAVLDRLLELLNLFSDEMIQIEKRKFKLSQFREIKAIKFDGRRIKDGILGRSSDSLWLSALKQEDINEDDVLEFAHECRKYKDKTQRKIIFAFNNIDSNARILAKEENILIWDIARLNSLLNLYGRSRIIL